MQQRIPPLSGLPRRVDADSQPVSAILADLPAHGRHVGLSWRFGTSDVLGLPEDDIRRAVSRRDHITVLAPHLRLADIVHHLGGGGISPRRLYSQSVRTRCCGLCAPIPPGSARRRISSGVEAWDADASHHVVCNLHEILAHDDDSLWSIELESSAGGIAASRLTCMAANLYSGIFDSGSRAGLVRRFAAASA
jgi:hypothetical protein